MEEAPLSPFRPHALKSNAVNNGIRICDLRLVFAMLILLSVNLDFVDKIFLLWELKSLLWLLFFWFEFARIQSFFAKCFVEKKNQAAC